MTAIQATSQCFGPFVRICRSSGYSFHFLVVGRASRAMFESDCAGMASDIFRHQRVGGMSVLERFRGHTGLEAARECPPSGGGQARFALAAIQAQPAVYRRKTIEVTDGQKPRRFTMWDRD